jgi:hypothetical protein
MAIRFLTKHFPSTVPVMISRRCTGEAVNVINCGLGETENVCGIWITSQVNGHLMCAEYNARWFAVHTVCPFCRQSSGNYRQFVPSDYNHRIMRCQIHARTPSSSETPKSTETLTFVRIAALEASARMPSSGARKGLSIGWLAMTEVLPGSR